MDDSRLAAMAADGDEDALVMLIERYRCYVYTIAYKITLNEEDALDVSQNVFVRLVEKIGRFSGRGAFRSWLATVTSREAIGYLRQRRRQEAPTTPGVLTEFAEEHQQSAGKNPREVAETAERLALVESVMHCLSPQQRAVFTLRLRENLKPKEIAKRLGIPMAQVCVQHHRAVARLREALVIKGVL